MNPTDAPAVPPALAFNTAVSFVTNTNWQNYGGELTMSHLTQMAGLAVQNFLSAAVGLAVAIALVRGLVRRRSATIGNFWVDLTRSTRASSSRLSIVLALILVSQGVVQNLHGFTDAARPRRRDPDDPRWPDREPGGDQGARHERRRPLQRQLRPPVREPHRAHELRADPRVALHPVRADVHYGRLVGDQRQGWAVFAAMFAIWIAAAGLATGFEEQGNPALDAAGAVGGNLEGKETRFGIATSGLFAASTTGTSTGAVNSAHDSYTPLGGAVPLVHMMLGEVSPGGVGAGLYGMLIFALLAVFLAGLMVGRTPEYVGKKIQATEMKLVVVYLAVVPIADPHLRGRSRCCSTGATASILNPGPHGLSEVVYAFTSAANNNGSAFGGLTGNTDWFNTTLGLAMAFGRFLLIIAVLAIAGSLARKQSTPVTAGTFPTGTPLFAGLLTVVVLTVVGLTYFPVISLGPVLEQLSNDDHTLIHLRPGDRARPRSSTAFASSIHDAWPATRSCSSPRSARWSRPFSSSRTSVTQRGRGTSSPG